jgi:hypothetical protein
VSNLHIYNAPSQPMTRHAITLDDGSRRWIRYNPRRKIWTDCCGKRRWAKYVRAQVFYDTTHRTCAPGHGCNAKGVRRG